MATEDKIQLSTEGTGKAYVSLTKNTWDESPEPSTRLSNISSRFIDDEQNEVKQLEKGKLYQLQVSLEVAEDAPYAMLEIPIPAGTNYQDKPASFLSTEHREYFKNKAVFYFELLKAGKHEFSISLNAQFPGNYHLNPAQLSLMYFPLVNANNGSSIVPVR